MSDSSCSVSRTDHQNSRSTLPRPYSRPVSLTELRDLLLAHNCFHPSRRHGRLDSQTSLRRAPTRGLTFADVTLNSIPTKPSLRLQRVLPLDLSLGSSRPRKVCSGRDVPLPGHFLPSRTSILSATDPTQRSHFPCPGTCLQSQPTSLSSDEWDDPRCRLRYDWGLDVLRLHK